MQAPVANTDNMGLEGRQRASLSERPGERIARASGAPVHDTSVQRLSNGATGEVGEPGAKPEPERSDWWLSEPDVGRVANGVPNRSHRLKALGNAVVPAVVTLWGKAIMEAVHDTE
jgi:DNA (cytosine-5)-methyltransferase 1